MVREKDERMDLQAIASLSSTEDTERATRDFGFLSHELRNLLCTAALAFDSMRDGDEIFEDHGLRLLVDGPSLPYVKGAVVDYVDTLQGAGFKVDNPNVIAACGCGSSFRVADEEAVSAV